MKNLDLREKYYYNLKNALIYPLKNSDGMLNLASMQRVFIKDSVLILVKGDNKISVMNSETSEFEYYIFNDEDSIVKYVTTSGYTLTQNTNPCNNELKKFIVLLCFSAS